MKTKLLRIFLLLSLANCSTTIKFVNAKAHEKMQDNESLSGEALRISAFALSDLLGKSDQNNKAFKKAYFNNDEKDKNIFALALGDSWFSYPRLNDTIDYLQKVKSENPKIYVYTTAVFGKEMNQILYEKDFKRIIKNYNKINAVLISAGGNDILDSAVLDDLIINPNNNSDKGEDYFNKEYLDSRLNVLKYSLESIALTLKGEEIPIIILGYISPLIKEQNAVCSKKFIEMCEWIRPILNCKKIPTSKQQLVTDYLIDKYNEMLKKFATDYNKKYKKDLIIYVNLKEKLAQNNINPYSEKWTDEIHPNEILFGKIADILAVEIATKSKGRK